MESHIENELAGGNISGTLPDAKTKNRVVKLGDDGEIVPVDDEEEQFQETPYLHING